MRVRGHSWTLLNWYLVPRAGIEPAAFPLGGGRSIHWATGANFVVYEKAVPSGFLVAVFCLFEAEFRCDRQRWKIDVKRLTGGTDGARKNLFRLVARIVDCHAEIFSHIIACAKAEKWA